jgi:hypothetical protein
MQHFQRRLAIVSHDGAMTLAVQHEGQTVCDKLVVINDQHVHSTFLITKGSRAAEEFVL